MKKLYEEYFKVSEDGKVREKVMITRVVVTVTVMVVCLIAMGVSAYAYFSSDILSASNVIRAANYEIAVTVQSSADSTQQVPVTKLDKRTYVATLDPGEYVVRVTKGGTAKTGFCVVTAAGCVPETYHTQQIGVDVYTGSNESISFTLIVTEQTNVEFYAHWGTSSFYAQFVEKGEDGILYIVDQENISLLKPGAEDLNETPSNSEEMIP